MQIFGLFLFNTLRLKSYRKGMTIANRSVIFSKKLRALSICCYDIRRKYRLSIVYLSYIYRVSIVYLSYIYRVYGLQVGYKSVVFREGVMFKGGRKGDCWRQKGFYSTDGADGIP